MFICPTCDREYENDKEQEFVKHYLACWKEKNPNHKSKNAPHSADIVKRHVDDGVEEFFNRLKGEHNGTTEIH